MSRVVLVEDGFALRLSHDEPPYVDAVSRLGYARIWLRPIAVEYAVGLREVDLRRLLELVAGHQRELLHAWASLKAPSGADPRRGRRP